MFQGFLARIVALADTRRKGGHYGRLPNSEPLRRMSARLECSVFGIDWVDGAIIGRWCSM